MELVGRDFIDYVREVNFGIGLSTENLSEKQKASFDCNWKFQDDAAKLLTEIHAKRPHFILELIQNAEDNDYLEYVKPKIKLIITSNELIIQNNEKGFSNRDVLGLCGIGDSKKDKKSGYIGEKGIGFKSVFMVTDEPHLYSNGFQFKFNYKKENPRSIIVPEWFDEIKNHVDLEQTNIILPLKSEKKAEIIKYVEQIDSSVLLFLRKLTLIEIENLKQGLSVRIEKHDYNANVQILNGTKTNYWKVIKKQFEPEIIEERRKDIEETEIILAFPLNEDQTAATYNEQFVFAYLPVQKYGFKFIIQADFLLPVSREDILKDNDWNKWLRDNICSVFLQALEKFKKDENLKKSFYNYIPLKAEADVKDDFFTPVVGQIHNSLKKTDCILTESKKETWRKPTEVLDADSKIKELFSNDDLKYFLNKEYISSDLKIKKPILLALGVDSFKFDNLLQCLQKTEWLNKQNDDWFIKLYTYLNSEKLDQEQIQKLKKLKIIRLEKDGELASNLNEPIFFPLENKSDYGFEKELRIIKRTILEPKETKNNIEKFFEKIKIQKAKPYEIIDEHILPIYESKNDSSNWQIKDDAVLLGYINYIFDNLGYYEKERSKRLNASKINEPPLKRLKNSLVIRTNKTFNNKKYYDRPENIYLPKVYGNKNDLETLFGPNEDIQFVSKKYIDSIVKKYRHEKRKNKKKKAEIRKKRETEINVWGDFFDKIGILKIPKVIYKYDKIYDPFSNLAQDYGYTGSKLQYKSYLSEEYFKNSIKAFEEITDYKLELDIQTLNTKQRILLLKIIDENWVYYKDYFSKQLVYKYRYSRKDSRWSTIDPKDCYFKYTLINTGWLPITKNIDPLPKSNEVFLDKPGTKAILGESVPYLAVDVKNQEFIKSLKINSDPTVEGVINHLKSIVQNRSIDKDTFINLYDFLSKNYENNQNIIKTAFTVNKIIYIPDTHQYYFTIRDVLWNDLSEIFGDNRGYLQKHYQKLKSFFVEKLGVNEKAKPKDYANILLDLSQKERLDKKDEKIIIEIYNELNSHLNPDIEEHLISSEDWWDDFIKEPIFWTDKNQFRKNDNDIYVNDKQEIYELFKNNSQIAFLKIPQNYHPKFQFFINSAKISYLSKAISANLANIKTAKSEKELTERLQRFFPYILRYLYYSEYSTYEKLKKLGIYTHINNFICFSVERLQVKYILNKQFALIDQKAFFNFDGMLYIQKDSLEDFDTLAVTLSEFLKTKGIEDFLILLFEKNTDDKIEKLLKAKGIQELPDGEKEEQENKSIEDQEDAVEGTEDRRQPEPESPGEKEQQKNKSIEDQQDAVEGTEKEWQPDFDPDDVEVKFDKFQKKKFKEPKTSNGKNGSNKKSFSSDEEDEVTDKLSQKAKKAIGKWGEKYAFKFLKKKFCAKYSNGNIEIYDDSFIIRFNGQVKVEAHWLNKFKDEGEGYDIEVIEDSNKKYIEVKSTKADAKDWFEVSRRQWELAHEEGDNFHIYRIYNAGTNRARLVDIPNPNKLWEEGELNAYPIRIKI
ncbi:Uncharacterised protein [uncultured archaeon]|nr:Uncharacterised protein [uncultured archaeon]